MVTLRLCQAIPFDHPNGERSPYVGAMLRVVWQWVRDQLYAGVVAAGFDDLNAAHVGLWRYPGLEGLRPSQLADRVGITKQSVNDLLGHLERHGYLFRVPDSGRRKGSCDPTLLPRDGGSSRQFMPRRGAASCGSQILGPRRFAQLHSSLELLTEQFGGFTGRSPNAG